MPDLLCPHCGASASLSPGLTCDNHQPQPIDSMPHRWSIFHEGRYCGTCGWEWPCPTVRAKEAKS